MTLSRLPTFIRLAIRNWPIVALYLLGAWIVGCSAFHPFGLGAGSPGNPLPKHSGNPSEAALSWAIWIGVAEAVVGALMLALSKGGAGKKLILAGVGTFLGAAFLHRYLWLIEPAAMVAGVLLGALEIYLHRERILTFLRFGPRQPVLPLGGDS